MPTLPSTNPGTTLDSMAAYVAVNADALYTIAEEFLNDLVDTRSDELELSPDQLNYLQWDMGADSTALAQGRPDYATVTDTVLNGYIDQLASLEAPTAPQMYGVLPQFPTLDAERPSISFPARPDTDVGAAPSDAPDLVEATLPDAPTVVLPTVPTFEELQLPAAPQLTLPQFSSEMPDFRLEAPTAEFSFVDADYTSDLRDPLVAKLLEDLENGTYGIEPAVEAALWSRARDRAAQQGREAIDAAKRAAANTSFPMPQGALFAQIEKARADMMRVASDANREIGVKRADMYVEGRKFTITEVQKYEQRAMDFHNSVQERALNASKATVELGIAVYDAGVRNFKAQLDAVQIEAQVFETRMRAEISKLDMYKTQLEAEIARGQFNVQKVELYKAQLAGIHAVTDLYKSRMEGANLLMQVQGQRIDMFKTRVSAYAERVRAKAAEYDMYRASVAGEVARLDVYKTDLAAHQTRVATEEARLRGMAITNDNLLQAYRARTAQFGAQLEALAKSVSARQERNKLYVDATGINANVYRAFADSTTAATNARIAAQRVNNEWNISAVQNSLDRAKLSFEQWKQQQEYRIDINKYGSKMYGDGALALLANLSGMNVKST